MVGTKRYRMRKLRTVVQEKRICGTRGTEKRIFVIAPIELLKNSVVITFGSFIEHIRSLRFLSANRRSQTS